MKKLFKNVLIVFFVTILSKVISFVSELIIAYILGTSQEADIYSMIVGIHQVIYPMLSVGIWSVFLPMYKKKITKGENAQKFVNNILSIFLIISLSLMLAIIIFSNQIVDFVAMGFNTEAKNTCAFLLRIYSPYFVFVIISSIFAAILQSNEKFFLSQMREVASHIPTIVFGPLLYRELGLFGLVLALVFGSTLRLLILIPAINNKKKLRFEMNFKDNDIIKMFKSMPNVLITSGIEQVNILIDKIMASNLIVGAVSSLSYGNKLINVINGLFTNAISTSIYPVMSKYVARKEFDKLQSIFSKSIYVVSIVVLPLSLLMILLSSEIVKLVFFRGNFDEKSVSTTSMVFSGYLIGMFYIGIKPIINNLYYSLENTKSIRNISLITIITNILLNFGLVNIIGIGGLALATSISSILYFIICIIDLNRKKYINLKEIVFNLLKLYLSCCVSYVITYYTLESIQLTSGIVYLTLSFILYAIVYFIMIKILKISGLGDLKIIINRLLKKGDKNEE